MQERTLQKNSLQNLSTIFDQDKIDLRDILYALLAEKWLILGVTVIVFLFGLFCAALRVPSYQTNVLVQVENKNMGMGSFGGGSLATMNSGPNSADVQIALIKSRFVLSSVIEKLGLDVSVQPRYFPHIGAWFARHHTKQLHAPLFGQSQYAWGGEQVEVGSMHVPLTEEGQPFKLIAGNNQTYQLYSSSGNLLFISKVGQRSQMKMDDIEYDILVKKLIANPGTEFTITKQSTANIADGLASQLQIIDLGALNNLDKTGVLQISLIGANPNYIVDLLNEITFSAVQKDTERKTIESAKTLDFLNKQLPIVKSDLYAAEAALNKYRTKTGTIDLNIKSRMIYAQIAGVQKNLGQVDLTRVIKLQELTPINPIIIGLNQEKMALEQELDHLERQLQRLPSADQAAINLMRDVNIKSQLYFLILHKIQELKVSKAGTVSDIRVLSLANMPNTPLPTGRFFIVLASVLFGLVLGSLIVVARRWFHTYVEDPNWLEQHFGIPTFAIIPYSRTQETNIKSHKENLKNLSLLAQTQPRDLSIEALRSLRTSLQFALIGSKNNIISIMGISPGTGKSFISANFAHILADSGKRVLLIDGDIRRGYLHQYFNGKRSPGLSEVVAHQVDLKNVIQKSHHANLDYIASGKFPPNPSELLMSDNFKQLMADVSSQYELVIIDTAPILAVTDGAIIGNLAGVNFLLVAAGKHQSEEIKVAMKRLHSNAVTVQGAIFNNSHARKSGQQKKFNYQYEYGNSIV